MSAFEKGSKNICTIGRKDAVLEKNRVTYSFHLHNVQSVVWLNKKMLNSIIIMKCMGPVKLVSNKVIHIVIVTKKM